MFKKSFTNLLIFSVFAVIAVLLISGFQTVRIIGSSMSPTFKNGDIAYAYKLFRNFKVGDVVVAKGDAWGTEKSVCKRILAGPGDIVVVDGNNLYINDIAIDIGPLPSSFKGFPYKKYTLNEDDYFLVGDNRTNSLDSRARGPMKKSDIEYKIIEFYRP